MKSLYFFIFVFISSIFSVNAQVPVPMPTSSPKSISGPSWTKINDIDYVLRDARGNTLTNVMDLVYLKTDTLAVLDKNSRTVYLLADFKNASQGAVGSAPVLSENIGKNFYLTNPYSFITYVNDKSYTGDFSNVKGSYIDYIKDVNATYYLDGIRDFSNWGVKSMNKLATAPDNTYWYRDAEKGRYGVIKKGKAIDYSKASTETDGNDLIVKIDNVSTYVLPGYKTMASFVFKPVALYTANGSTTSSPSTGTTGCISGDCTNGWGKWQYEDAYYDGFWKNGLKHGYGLYKWEGIGKYIGNWQNDTMTGYGAYIADNDDNIVGEYGNGKLNGAGYTVTGGDWKQGIYSNGVLSTSYTFYTNEIETGCTAGDCQNKYGKMVWSNGDTFIGFFKKGNLYMGSYTFANGDKYSGMFNDKNQFHGTGRYFYKTGGYYGGEWKNNQYNGKGYYHDKDLVRQVGEWSNGVLVTKM